MPPLPTAPVAAGHPCAAPGCEQRASVQWRRQHAAGVVAVFACAAHALTPDASAALHAESCAAPPTCTCTPTQPGTSSE